MIEISFLILIFFIACSLGKKVFRLTGLEFGSFSEELVFSVALGLGIISSTVFILGIFKIIYTELVYLLLILCVLFSIQDIKALIKELWDRRKVIKLSNLSFFNKLLLSILVFCILVLFISTYVPPIDRDDQYYHLALAKTYIINKGFIYVPYSVYSNFPSQVDMFFILGLMLKGDLLAQQLHFLFGILSTFLTFLFARKYFSFDQSFLAAVIFLTIPTVLYLSSIAYIDLALIFYFTLAIYSYYQWKESKERKWVLLSGLMAGFTAASKSTGIAAAFLLGIFFLSQIIISKKEIGLKNSLLVIIGYTLPAIGLVFPWLAKSYIYTGNPFFPIAYEIFGGKNWSPAIASIWSKFTLEHIIFFYKKIYIFPWMITMDYQRFSGKIGPIFLSFIPAAFIGIRGNKKMQSFLLFILAFLIFPPFIVSIRYMCIVAPLMSIIASVGVYNICETGSRINKISVRILILIALIVNTAVLASSFFRPLNSDPPTKSLKVVFGLESREAYLFRVLPYYAALDFINKRLSPENKVLIIGETRAVGGYYLEKSYINGSPIFQAYINYRDAKNDKEILKSLEEKGASHVLLEDNFLDGNSRLVDRFDPERNKTLFLIKNLIQNYTDAVYRKNGYTVYKLKY